MTVGTRIPGLIPWSLKDDSVLKPAMGKIGFHPGEMLARYLFDAMQRWDAPAAADADYYVAAEAMAASTTLLISGDLLNTIPDVPRGVVVTGTSDADTDDVAVTIVGIDINGILRTETVTVTATTGGATGNSTYAYKEIYSVTLVTGTYGGVTASIDVDIGTNTSLGLAHPIDTDNPLCICFAYAQGTAVTTPLSGLTSKVGVDSSSSHEDYQTATAKSMVVFNGTYNGSNTMEVRYNPYCPSGEGYGRQFLDEEYPSRHKPSYYPTTGRTAPSDAQPRVNIGLAPPARLRPLEGRKSNAGFTVDRFVRDRCHVMQQEWFGVANGSTITVVTAVDLTGSTAGILDIDAEPDIARKLIFDFASYSSGSKVFSISGVDINGKNRSETLTLGSGTAVTTKYAYASLGVISYDATTLAAGDLTVVCSNALGLFFPTEEASVCGDVSGYDGTNYAAASLASGTQSGDPYDQDDNDIDEVVARSTWTTVANPSATKRITMAAVVSGVYGGYLNRSKGLSIL